MHSLDRNQILGLRVTICMCSNRPAGEVVFVLTGPSSRNGTSIVVLTLYEPLRGRVSNLIWRLLSGLSPCIRSGPTGSEL